MLGPVVARYRGGVKRLYFRGDAAFANPEMYEYLEAERIGYAIRLPASRAEPAIEQVQARAAYARAGSTERAAFKGHPFACSFKCGPGVGIVNAKGHR